ncbi:hypothetical protein GF325_11350 [Candidatus Bathyarchaeota archaeon]|nr:hypothetical protein [Candidatus Bathyarchaeota archaeon]
MERKKIIFVGPPGAGKTTLRKVYFQYESAEQLLKFEEDPTYGMESIVLNFGEPIGVFDLAGQEIKQWLNDDHNDIFDSASNIIVVIESTSDDKTIHSFINKILDIREKRCPGASVYVNLHKVDLLEEPERKLKEDELLPRLHQQDNLIAQFTSIKKEFFMATLDFFKDIIQDTLDREIQLEGLDYNRIKYVVSILNQFMNKSRITRQALLADLKLDEKTFDSMIDMLHARGYLRILNLDDQFEYELTIEDKHTFYDSLVEFTRKKLATMERKFKTTNVRVEIEAPPFIGILLSDTMGKNILTGECHAGAFNKYLGVTAQTELDLIPPFISALEHFSKEIKVMDITDFKLKGKNLAIYVINIDQLFITFFMNPGTNISEYKTSMVEWLKAFIIQHEHVLQKAIDIGVLENTADLEIELNAWIDELNANYKERVDALEIFDVNQSKQLFKSFEKFRSTIQKQVKRALTELEKLESKLVQAVMEQDINRVKEINDAYKDLQVDFYNRD